jgi:hypothetical protein
MSTVAAGTPGCCPAGCRVAGDLEQVRRLVDCHLPGQVAHGEQDGPIAGLVLDDP